MKIKLSKSQWRMIGTKAGWMKKANSDIDTYIKTLCNELNKKIIEFKDDNTMIDSYGNINPRNTMTFSEAIKLPFGCRTELQIVLPSEIYNLFFNYSKQSDTIKSTFATAIQIIKKLTKKDIEQVLRARILSNDENESNRNATPGHDDETI